MHHTIIRALLAPSALCMSLLGCESYEPLPLDPDGHRQAWLERSPHSESVLEFARRLEADSATPAQFDPDDGVSLAEAEVIALVFNPELRLARLRAGVNAATAEHAGRWDDPELAIDVLRITESVSSPWVITPGLAFTIPISGRLGVEQSRADAALRAALLGVAEDEWAVRHRLRRMWAEWSTLTMRSAEIETLLASLDRLVDSTARLVEVGEMPRTEATLFVIERSHRRQELLRLQGELATSELRLRMLLGLSPDAPLELIPSIEPTPLPRSGDAGLRELTGAHSLTLARLREAYEVAEQTVHREIRKQYPDLTIGPLYETDQGQSRIGFLGAIPLPVLNANKQGIAEARASRELARADYETAYERLIGELVTEQTHVASLAEQRETLVSLVGPMVDRQVDDAQRLLELGEGDGLVLLESRVRAHETKMEILDVRRNQALASAAIAFLVGPADDAMASSAMAPDEVEVQQ